MDYPDTDELNFAKDARDLNEYCSIHEMPYQDLDHQGMMTEEKDLLEKPEYLKENKKIFSDKIETQKLANTSVDNNKKQKITIKSDTADARETPSGFI